MKDALNSYWTQNHRRWQLRAEELDAQVALGYIAQHAWHDPPPVKGFAISAHGVLAARSASYIVERRRRKRFLRFLLEKRVRDRNRKTTASQTECINLLLALHAGGN